MAHDRTDHPSDSELFDFVEGTAQRTQRAAVEQHLSKCSQCTDLVATAQAGKTHVSTQPLEQLPAHVAQQLHAALDAQWQQRRTNPARARSPKRWMTRGLAFGLAVATATVLGVVVANVNQGSAPTTANDSGALKAKKPASAAPEESGLMAPDAEVDSVDGGAAGAPADTASDPLANQDLDSKALGDDFAEGRQATDTPTIDECHLTVTYAPPSTPGELQNLIPVVQPACQTY